MDQLVIASPEFSFKISSILVENGEMDPIEEIQCTEASELSGLHFASIPHFVIVKFKGKEKKLHLFIKKSIPFPTADLIQFGVDINHREGVFLKNIVTDINEFMLKAAGVKDFLRPYFPKTYYFDQNGAVMENLYKAGYGMHDKAKKHGHTAALAVIRALAKFHGASWLWTRDVGGESNVREKYPILWKDVLDDPAGFELMETMIGKTLKTLVLIVEKDDTILDKESFMKKYGKHSTPGTSVYGDVKEKLRSSSRIRMLTHSDCWTNNMMFKPDHTAVKLLDFQVVRYNCPLIDLAEYLATSVLPSVRKQWKSLFNAYFLTLKETLEMTGKDCPFTLNDVLDDFASKHEVGLVKGIHLTFGKEAHEAYNVHDTEDGLNPDDYAAVVFNWIQKNPVKVNSIIKECVELVNDFVAVQPYVD